MPHPQASLKILAVLDHKAMTAEELASKLGKSRKTVLNQLAKLVKWEQVETVDEREVLVPNGIITKGGKAVFVTVRSRILKTTDRGRGRLKKKGGHRKICPECSTRKTTRE